MAFEESDWSQVFSTRDLLIKPNQMVKNNLKKKEI